MIHVFDWLASQLRHNGPFENQTVYGIFFSVVRYLYKRLHIIYSSILEKQGRIDIGL